MAQADQRAGAWLGEQEFRDAMSLLAAPVSVVTVADSRGWRWGFTASSVTSVSLAPPLVLFGIAHTSSCHAAAVAAGEFAINVLGDGHQQLAKRFAAHGSDRFAGGEFEPWPGGAAPLLPGAHVALRCVTAQIVPAGDHDLVIGAVVEARTGPPGDPLVWHRRGFVGLA